MPDGTTLFRIWAERDVPATYRRLLDGHAVVIGSASSSDGQALATIGDAQAIIASSRIRYDGELMDLAPALRVISRTGIGLDNIAIEDATKRGIAICHAPDGPTISTAEHAITLILAVAKILPSTAQALLNGRGDLFNDYDGVELNGLQLGVVGLGKIGRRVATFGTALGMNVTAFDPFVDPGPAEAAGIRLVPDLGTLLAEADVVSLHAPLTLETRHLIDAARIAQMKSGAILVNTARGGLVDEQALLDALETGHLRGAGLDVFEQEPPHPTNALLHREDVIATPHIAGATTASRDRLWRIAITQALQVLRSERPANLANPEIWTEAVHHA